MPASSAAPTTRPAPRASGATPNVAVPRQIFDTFTPVGPSREYSIGSRSSAVDPQRMLHSQTFSTGVYSTGADKTTYPPRSVTQSCRIDSAADQWREQSLCAQLMAEHYDGYVLSRPDYD